MIWNKKTNLKKISFISQIWLKHWKRKKTKKNFWLFFDLKPILENKNQNFRIHYLISNQKMNFIKFFHFSILVMKLKNEKWKLFKIRFVFKSKNELYFRYTDWFKFHFSFFFEIRILVSIWVAINMETKFEFMEFDCDVK